MMMPRQLYGVVTGYKSVAISSGYVEILLISKNTNNFKYKTDVEVFEKNVLF